MNEAKDHLSELFGRDLLRLIQQVQAFPEEEMIWRTVPGITNSAGNLVLHIEGNLREYIGRRLGNLQFERNREAEFAAKLLSREELVSRIENLRHSVPRILAALSAQRLDSEYPEVVLEKALSTGAFVIHLYGHLNWHLGQVDYLRRVLSGEGAMERVGL